MYFPMEKTKPVKINVPMTEDLWTRLRRIAEQRRTHGRASVSGVILSAVEEMLAREAEGGRRNMEKTK